MITMDKLEPVIRFEAGKGSGTAFALSVDDKQYLVTARHLLPNSSTAPEIRLWLFDTWHDVSTEVVGSGPSSGPPETDFIILACAERVSPFSLTATRGGFAISQDVYFLGYPYNSMTDGLFHPNLAWPLVKKAIVSGVLKASIKPGLIVLDGHNNPGFSGGPVLAQSPEDGEVRAIGIVSGYQTDLKVDGASDDAWVEVNAGIIYVAPMMPVLDAIDANPIGYPIEGDWDWHNSRFARQT